MRLHCANFVFLPERESFLASGLALIPTKGHFSYIQYNKFHHICTLILEYHREEGVQLA